jgi:hypothetical protein
MLNILLQAGAIETVTGVLPSVSISSSILGNYHHTSTTTAAVSVHVSNCSSSVSSNEGYSRKKIVLLRHSKKITTTKRTSKYQKTHVVGERLQRR